MSTLRTNNLQNPDSSSVNIELTQNGGAIFSGVTTVSSNLNVTGVLTYEDVTNIDSIGVVTARSSVNVGASGNPHGKLHVYTDSLNADNGYNGQNFGIVVETEDGNNDGDEGNGICFTQQYSTDAVDSGKVRTGAIIGYKDQAPGNFGGGLKFKVQQFGASPLLTAMTMNKSGNIGIGIDNPGDKLVVHQGSDDDIILRVNHVKERMQKPEKKIGQPEIHDEKPKSITEARLRGLLLYLTSGDEAMLELQVEEALEANDEENAEEEDERLTEEEEKTQLRAHLGMLNQPKLARTAKWGDFLDDMMNKYPLRHRINLDAQQRLAQRIVRAKQT